MNVFVRDAARAVAFYRDALGLALEHAHPEHGYAAFRAGALRLGVAAVGPGQEELVGRHTGVGFAVADLEAEHRRLAALGVAFPQPPARQPWGGFLALLADPDGNLFYLDEVSAAHPEEAGVGPLVVHRGGCHCGAVRFEVDAPAAIEVHACNCSICRALGYLHLIVPKSRFRLLSGRERLTSYRFHTGTAQHLFCSACGVKSFYAPRSHPDGWSVNARCLDPGSVARVVERPFDGASWEAHAAELPPLAE